MSFRQRLSGSLTPDPRDLFFLAGLALTFVGLYQFRPWMAYAICGALLMAISLTMRGS